MKYYDSIALLKKDAIRVDHRIGDAKWYLFGSAKDGLRVPSDIDIVVVCRTHDMADAVHSQ